MTQPVQVTNNVAAQRFEAVLEGDVAFAEYRRIPEGLLLPHTVVPDAFAGRGVGGDLARAALEYARAEGLKVVPTCSFIAGWISRRPEYADLVHPDYRARLGL
jgi:predicted GNAT family acetyltransferase